MRLDTDVWSYSDEGAGQPARWQCPSCGAGLPPEALSSGQRLARCRKCSQMLRLVSARNWPTHPSESAPHPLDRGYSAGSALMEQLEPLPGYPPPALQCPYCEHVNTDSPSYRASGQQFCANCGADLKKDCLNCDASLYVLDYYCTRCRSDQEQLKYEIEAVYWQHYNEGKRLAALGRWQDAERELSLFFGTATDFDREHLRRARQIYVRSIAPYDAGEGLRIYNDVLEQLRLLEEDSERRLQRRKRRKWVLAGAGFLLLALFSASTLGSWWAIFIVAPVVALLLVLLILFLFGSLGLF